MTAWAERATTVPNAVSARTAWISASAETDAWTAQVSALRALKNVQTAPRRKSAADAVSAKIAQAVTVISAITAKPARCARISSASAAADARSAWISSAPNVTKNAPNVHPRKSAADAVSAKIAQAVTVISAITAKPARCARISSASAVRGARNAWIESARSATKNALNVQMMSCVWNAACVLTAAVRSTSA